MHSPYKECSSGVAGASRATPLPGGEHQTTRSPPGSFLRRSFALVVAASLASVPAGPVAAATGKAPAGRRHQVMHAGHKHLPPARPGRARHGQAGPARMHHRAATNVPSRAKVAFLVNTTWDNSAMSPAVLEAILAAAGRFEIAPELLMAIAWRESRFASAATSRLSSATGLLQFTSGTWLQTVRQFGSQHGIPEYAALVHRSRSGELTVQGLHTREAVLALRNDPILSAGLAAEVLGRQRMAMQASMGRRTTPADLYLVHVLGPSGTARFLTFLTRSPSAPVLRVASRKVLRNAGLLARDGHPLTVAGTYEAIRTMLDEQHAHFEPAVAVASRIDMP